MMIKLMKNLNIVLYIEIRNKINDLYHIIYYIYYILVIFYLFFDNLIKLKNRT
jgi:hypothetical protein